MRGLGQWVTTCTVPGGPQGPDGAKINDDPPQNVVGQDGNVKVSTRSTDDAADRIAAATSLLYLQTALRAAEESYANSALDDALEQLKWLGRLLIRPQVTRTSRESIHDSGLDAGEPSQEIHAIRQKVFTLIQRMALELDYWGNTRNFVPLLNRTAYLEALDDLLEHAKTIEDSYIRYRDARDDWGAAREAFSDAIIAQEAFILGLGSQFQELARVERALVADIETLTNAYDASWHTVLAAGKDFKAAVRRKSRCKFKDVMVAVGAIATTVGTMGSGSAAAMAAWQAYRQFDAKKHDTGDKLGSLAEPKYKVDKLVSIGKGVAQVANGVSKIADILNRPNVDVPDLPSDAAKLIMSRQDLQETVEPFMHQLREARDYLERVDEFIDLVTIRNDKILEYNALANTRAEALSDIDAAEIEVARLRKEIVRPNVRHLPEFASYMSRANMMNKRAIMQMLYKQHRALEYWSGEVSEFHLCRDSIDHLSATHSSARIRLLSAMENRGRPPQTIKFVDQVARFSIKEIGQEYLDRFKSARRLIFRLPYDPFDGLALVRVVRVRIGLPGAVVHTDVRGKDPFGVQLTHFGSATMRTLQGNLIEFRHEPRHTVLFYHAGTEVTRAFDLGGSDTFIKLTPEGPWQLSILEPDVNRVNLNALKDIVIEFEGEFFRSHN